MPRISQSKKDRIAEQVLHHLFTISPSSAFTSQISAELARDEEFILLILKDLLAKKLVVSISKNPSGTPYSRRKRWRLSSDAYDAYKKHQSNQSFNAHTSDQSLEHF